MLDTDLRTRLKSLLPGRADQPCGILPGLAVATALSLILLSQLYTTEIDKIPLNTSLTRLDYLLADCLGVPSGEVQRLAAKISSVGYPDFRLTQQLAALHTRLDMLENNRCVRAPGHQVKFIDEFLEQHRLH